MERLVVGRVYALGNIWERKIIGKANTDFG